MYFRKSRPRTTCLYSAAVDLTAQGVSRFPEDFGVGQVGGGYALVRHAGFSPLFFGGQAPCHSGRYMYDGDCCILTELRQRLTLYAHSCHRQWWVDMIADPCLVGSSATAER